jgi:glucose/mannose transport system substrate-binding protein
MTDRTRVPGLAVQMPRRRFLQASLGTAGLLAVGANLALPPLIAGAAGKLEIFSWWTSPGEVEALDALLAAFKSSNSSVDIVNAALAGGTGAGGNMKAVLQTRMLAGQPPDSFQVHLGHELIDGHVRAGRMESIDFLYQSEGWSSTFPDQLLSISQSDGHQWAVPVNIHRSNVLWYNQGILAGTGAPLPTTFHDFLNLGETLKAQGIPLIAIGESSPGHAAHVFENVLLGELGAQGYKGLWTGATPWSDPGVTQALTTFDRLLSFANPDYLSIDWTTSTDLMIAGRAFSVVNGDWNNGYLKSKRFTDFGYGPTPQTSGVYNALADSFGLPKGAVDRDNAIAWLKIAGSIAGQDAFNPLKGSIPARIDAGLGAGYDSYQRSAMDDFKSNVIVPSVVHGFAARESWVTDYVNTVNVFAVVRDVAAAQQSLVQAAQVAGFG